MSALPAVLVTNASGSLGCGVLRLLRAMKIDGLRVIGIAKTEFSAANHLCDRLVQASSGYFENETVDSGFVDSLCREEQVGLIIPTSDFETVALKHAQDRLPWVACSDEQTSLAFFDKLLTHDLFLSLGLRFAPTCLPSAYNEQFQRPLVKPRRGGLSRGLVLDPEDSTKFGDEFIVQEFLEGTEITAAFYVTKDRALHGQIAFTRELMNGTTIRAETTDACRDQISAMARALIDGTGVSGSCNIQGRIVDGVFTVFEVNGRVSGTASIRAQFGFEDVRWLVEEYLLGARPSPCITTNGRAVRMLTDVIYPEGETHPHYF